MKIKVTRNNIINGQNPSASSISGKCPSCGKHARFDFNANVQDAIFHTTLPGGVINLVSGQRWCPDPECIGHVFFLYFPATDETCLYPREMVSFDSLSIPSNIKEHFEEALVCHAEECYTAAALMIRRTLEELCEEQGAGGKDLNERIKVLSGEIIIPKQLVDGMHNLRLLGNDAAHVNSKDFESVGKEEVEVGIDLAKEILKAVYQMDNLVKRLTDLKIKHGERSG